MIPVLLNRRLFLAGSAASLGACSAIAAVDEAATPLDTYDLTPVPGPAGARGGATLLVLEPETPAALNSDRMLIRPTPQSVAYLPDARWVDILPLLLQSLLIRSLAATERAGFVGASGAGPVPDMVLLTRVDRFDLSLPAPGSAPVAEIDMTLTLLRDIDQSIAGSRRIEARQALADDSPQTAVAGFQALLAAELPGAIDWVLDRVV